MTDWVFTAATRHLKHFVANSIIADITISGQTKKFSVTLRPALKGMLDKFFWEVSNAATKGEIVQLLRNQPGNNNQSERFMAE
jgi:hypothetical protein